MEEGDALARSDCTAGDVVDQPGHGPAAIDRIKQKRVATGGQINGAGHAVVYQPIAGGKVGVAELNIIVANYGQAAQHFTDFRCAPKDAWALLVSVAALVL